MVEIDGQVSTLEARVQSGGRSRRASAVPRSKGALRRQSSRRQLLTAIATTRDVTGAGGSAGNALTPRKDAPTPRAVFCF